MSILTDLQSIRPLNSASVASLVDISSENFNKISQALYTFLINIQYDENTNGATFNSLGAAVMTVNKKLLMLVNGNEMFSVDQAGRVKSKSYVSDDLIQTKRLRLSTLSISPAAVTGGEVIYGQVYTDQQNTTLSNTDFWGYVQGTGWFSLTGQSGSSFIPATSAVWVGEAVSIESTPPVTPARPGIYIVDWTTSGNLQFAGHEGEIAIWDFVNLEWQFTDPQIGSAVSNAAEGGKIYIRQYGSPIAWAAGGGYSGTSGYSGYSGLRGYSGLSGLRGYSGLSGAAGASGYSGTSGYSGYNGSAGTSGYSGASGYSGLRGYSGLSGSSGASGSNGYSGLSGRSGYSGYSGYSGSGASGYSGALGASGYSGYSGRSGYSGATGYSGVSGYSGNPYSLTMKDLNTTDATPTIIETISGITNNAITLVKSYVTAYGSDTLYGAWARTIVINTKSGTSLIKKENEDLTEEGTLSTPVTWSINISGELEITVTGTAAPIYWVSKYEIIMP